MTFRPRTNRPLRVVTAALVMLAAQASGQPTESVWQAGTGLRPDEVCPAWKLIDTAPGADPVLADGKLVLATGEPSRDMFYVQALPLPLPDPLVIEATVQFTSGGSRLDSRGPVAFAITTAANTGTLFFVGAGEIFVTATGDVRGQSAAVDTAEAPHTYRIEVTGAGAVSVSYDGAPMLTGTTYRSAPAFGGDPRILWGEGSVAASGKEAWMSFHHNATTCGGSTTPTTLPPACDGTVPGSLAAVRCRLDALAGLITADATLGSFQSKLRGTLARVTSRVQQGDRACAAGDTRTARRRVKQAQKLLQNMSHRLLGLSARKRLDASVRSSLTTTIDGIRAAVGSLRRSPCL